MILPFHGVLPHNDDGPPHLHPIQALVAELRLHLTWHKTLTRDQRLEQHEAPADLRQEHKRNHRVHVRLGLQNKDIPYSQR